MIERVFIYLRNNFNWSNICCLDRGKYSILKEKSENNLLLNFTNNNCNYKYLNNNESLNCVIIS